MLKKLLKYEFRATARRYGGLYLALLGVSVLFGLSLRGGIYRNVQSNLYDTYVAVMGLVYTAVLIGTVVVTIMTIEQRFCRNLLGREGYLMHTLPVTEVQLVTSKLISSTVWSVCSILMAGFSFGLMGFILVIDIGFIDQLPLLMSKLCEAFRYHFDGSFWGAMAFAGLLCFVRMVSIIACIYAACMMSHQFKQHSTLAGILSFLGFQMAEGWLEHHLGVGTSAYEVAIYTMVGDGGSIKNALSAMGFLGSQVLSLTVAVAFGVLWFGLTVWLMRNRLNLE